jgi:hypothetical protein
MRIVAGVCLAALALAACNKPAEKTDAAGSDATAPAAAKPVPPGVEAAPHLKAGLWEITVEDMPARARSCIDDKTQAESAALGQGLDRRNCSKSDWNRIPGGIAFSFDCDNDGTRVTSKGTVTGDFNSAYRMEADASMTKDGVTQTAKQVIDARYIGVCPAGMKPGDKQITVNGRTISVPSGAGGPSTPGG